MAEFQLIDLGEGNGGDGEVRDNFRDALRDLYARIQHVHEHRILTQQWLETAIWIRITHTVTELTGPIYFYDARDIAHHYGLVDDGGKTIKDDVQEPDEDILLEAALLCAAQGTAKEYIENLKAVA
tara:strand:- start:6791 stop:7168 length:378 start_codon:yes stop_codon:yes gene_type:complete